MLMSLSSVLEIFELHLTMMMVEFGFLCLVYADEALHEKQSFKKSEIKASTVTEMFRYWNLKYLKISRYFTKLFLS